MTPKIKVAVGPCSGIDTSEYLDEDDREVGDGDDDDDDDDVDDDGDGDVIVCRVSCLSMSMDYEGTFDDDTTLAMRTMRMKKIMIRTMKMIGKERRSWEIVALVRVEPKEKLIIMIFPKFEEETRC